jgi:hypothetical protein
VEATDLYSRHILKGITGEEVERRLALYAPCVLDKDDSDYGNMILLDGVDRTAGRFTLGRPKLGPRVKLEATMGCGPVRTLHRVLTALFWEPTLEEIAAQLDDGYFAKYLYVNAFVIERPPLAFQFAYLRQDGTVTLTNRGRDEEAECLHFGVLSYYRATPIR